MNLAGDFTCSLCFEIFNFPVTLPCNHVFCKECLDGHLANNHLRCPLCRSRIQCWLRQLKLRKINIVDTELWEEVKKKYPKRTEIGDRTVKQDEEGVKKNSGPVLKLAEPGELRRFYEESLQKEMEERRKEEEKNFCLSEALIKIIEEDIRKEEEERLDQLKHDEELARSFVAEEGEAPQGISDEAALRKRTTKKEKPRKRKIDTDDTDSDSYADSDEFEKALESDDPVFLGPVSAPAPLDSISISSTDSDITPLHQRLPVMFENTATQDAHSSIPKKRTTPSPSLPFDPVNQDPQRQVCSPYNKPSTSRKNMFGKCCSKRPSHPDPCLKQRDNQIPSTSKDVSDFLMPYGPCQPDFPPMPIDDEQPSASKDTIGAENVSSPPAISISHPQLSMFASVDSQASASETEAPKERDCAASRCSSGADSIGQELHHFRPITTSPTTLTKDGRLPQLVVPQRSNSLVALAEPLSGSPAPEKMAWEDIYLAQDKQIENDRRLALDLVKEWEKEDMKEKVKTEYNFRHRKEVAAPRSKKRKRSSGKLREKVLLDRSQATLDNMLIK